jgi:hypothetical protein
MRVYGASRRLDLASLLVMTSLLAVLFSLLRVSGGPWWLAMLLCGALLAVGTAQALLFGGHRPRTASVAAGIAMALLLVLGISAGELLAVYREDRWSAGEWAIRLGVGLVTAVGHGALLGYLAGGLVGGVFLLAQALRRALKRSGADSAGGALR